MHDYLAQATSSETPTNSFDLICRRRYAVRQTAADSPRDILSSECVRLFGAQSWQAAFSDFL